MYCITVVLVSLAILGAGNPPSELVLSPPGPCGGEFQGTAGAFSYPTYPGNYPPHARCTWIVTSPDYTVIQVTFERFHTYNGNDYLEIRDGNSSNDPQLAKCTYTTCSDVTSTGNTLHFYFYSNNDPDTVSPGFKLNWVAGLVSKIDVYSCNNIPYSDGDLFDPACGVDNYHGKFGWGYHSAFTNVHYDGTHYVERGMVTYLVEEGHCIDTGYSIICYCNQDFCNSDLCQNCTSITTSPITTTTQLPTTTQPATTDPPSTLPRGLQCYSCINCSTISEETDVEISEEFLTCLTAIALGNPNFVARGGSPDLYEDGTCRHEGNGVIICYCTGNRCNDEDAADM